MAMEIQKSYLPPEELCLPRSEMRVRYRPARTIGGDFYASIVLSEDRLLAALGDVSGKGIPAALTTAQITTEMLGLRTSARSASATFMCPLLVQRVRSSLQDRATHYYTPIYPVISVEVCPRLLECVRSLE